MIELFLVASVLLYLFLFYGVDGGSEGLKDSSRDNKRRFNYDNRKSI